MSRKDGAYLDGVDVLGALTSPRTRVGDAAPIDAAAVASQVLAEVAAPAQAPAASASVPAERTRALQPFVAPPSPFVAPAPAPRVLPTELPGVADDAAWTEFVFAMRTALPQALSASNGYGMFELKPRRLADLGLMDNLRRARGAGGRVVWAGDFVKPLTAKKFLASPTEQYKAFGESMRRYVAALQDGSLGSAGVTDLSLSGMLAVLHRNGPHGLSNWAAGDHFTDTEALVALANGVF